MERCDPERPMREFTVAAAVEAVPSARRQVAAVVGKLGFSVSDEFLETVELLASEVIANAVLYSDAPCDVAVTRIDERLRVEVTDIAPSLPSAVEAGPNDECGRGLLLVDALADAWGVRPEPPGKTTWFEIAPESLTENLGYDSTCAQPLGAAAMRLADREDGIEPQAKSRAPSVQEGARERQRAA